LHQSSAAAAENNNYKGTDNSIEPAQPQPQCKVKAPPPSNSAASAIHLKSVAFTSAPCSRSSRATLIALRANVNREKADLMVKQRNCADGHRSII
jgi:hypothetical protein